MRALVLDREYRVDGANVQLKNFDRCWFYCASYLKDIHWFHAYEVKKLLINQSIRRDVSLVVCWMSIVLWATQVLGTDDRSPLSPATALERFQLADGFRIELVATEPETLQLRELGHFLKTRLLYFGVRPKPVGGADLQVKPPHLFQIRLGEFAVGLLE